MAGSVARKARMDAVVAVTTQAFEIALDNADPFKDDFYEYFEVIGRAVADAYARKIGGFHDAATAHVAAIIMKKAFLREMGL